MSQTIKIEQLADTVIKGMEDYAKLAVEDLKKDVQKAGKVFTTPEVIVSPSGPDV